MKDQKSSGNSPTWWGINIIKITTLPKVTHRFTAIPIKISKAIFFYRPKII